jgi:hypothetical protein
MLMVTAVRWTTNTILDYMPERPALSSRGVFFVATSQARNQHTYKRAVSAARGCGVGGVMAPPPTALLLERAEMPLQRGQGAGDRGQHAKGGVRKMTPAFLRHQAK